MRALVSWLFWFALIGVCFSAGAIAAPLRLEDGHGAYYIAKDVEMLTDADASMTIDQVAASHDFGPFGLMPNHRAAYWLRLNYDHSATNDNWFLFLGYKPDLVDMYAAKAGGGYDVQHSGILVPYANRPVRAYGVVSFILPSHASTVYVRVKTIEPDLTLAIDPSGIFWKVNEINLLIIVAVDAVLAALLVGTVALFFMSRNAIFWVYGAYLLAELLYRSNSAGMVSAFLWQHLSFSPEQFGVVFDAIRIVALTMMLRFFLNLRRHSLLMDRLNFVIIGVAIIYGVLSIAGFPQLDAARRFALIYVPVWLVSAIVAWRRGEPQAPLVVVAWAFFMIGSYAFALKQFGFGRGNLTTELLISHGTDIGIALQGLFLSLALSTELQQLSKAKDRFEKLSVHDALTGVGNRRLMESALEREWMRAIRGRKPIGLLVTDIDNFKGFNDRYGHAAGDVALIDVAKCGESAMRGGDLFCRYGGEEFVAILPEADAAGAMAVATRLRQAVNEARIPSEKSPSGFLTVSVGVVSMIPDASWPSSTLFERADQALYRAKETGRNRVEMSCVNDE